MSEIKLIVTEKYASSEDRTTDPWITNPMLYLLINLTERTDAHVLFQNKTIQYIASKKFQFLDSSPALIVK